MLYDLPTKITIGDKDFNIRNKGDYRVVLDAEEALGDLELSDDERIISSLIIFYEDINSIEDINKIDDLETAIKEMFKFINLGKDEKPGLKTNYNLIDYNKDAELICSAVNNVANTEIRALPYLHWWTFMGYYMAIGECTLSTIVGIRYKIASHQKLEKYEQKFRKENPQYFDVDYRSKEEQKITEDFITKVWNKANKGE